MKSGFAVSILPGVAQGLMGEGGVLQRAGKACRLMPYFAKTAVMTTPAHISTLVGDFQRCAVQVSAEPVNLPTPVVAQMVDSRQRTPGFVRVIKVCAALPAFVLLLQQAVSLPEEAGFGGTVGGDDVFSGYVCPAHHSDIDLQTCLLARL